jgi:hypothetical protein
MNVSSLMRESVEELPSGTRWFPGPAHTLFQNRSGCFQAADSTGCARSYGSAYEPGRLPARGERIHSGLCVLEQGAIDLVGGDLGGHAPP